MDAIPVGRIAGFAVRVNWSVVVLLWLFTWSLATTLPERAPGHAETLYWLTGACGALLLLGSLLAHEITHAVLASRAGVGVSDVTLWLFGGVTRLNGEAKTPTDAFAVAVSGPLTSLSIAAVVGGAGLVLDALGAPAIAVGAASWLAAINFVLGLFNLLPGAPLDGGRVLQAYLWHRCGDRVSAGIRAAHAGGMLGFGLIALGLAAFAAGPTIGGVWLAFLGWVVLDASRAEEIQLKTHNLDASFPC